MRQKARTDKPTADRIVKGIRRKTRKHHSAEEKIRIVFEGLRGEETIAANYAALRVLCAFGHFTSLPDNRLFFVNSIGLSVTSLPQTVQEQAGPQSRESN